VALRLRQLVAGSHGKPSSTGNRLMIVMSRFRWGVVAAGLLVAVPAAALLVAAAAGLLPADAFAFAGHSGLRALGAAAVGGCLLAAIGSWET
jgi:hypothetical protein